jgi:hypothetical protein
LGLILTVVNDCPGEEKEEKRRRKEKDDRGG